MHDGRTAPCRYCGRECILNSLPQHECKCIRNPDMWERVAAALASPTPGIGIYGDDYPPIAKALGLPARSTLRDVFGDSWADILDAFGLVPPKRRWRSAAEKAQAPGADYEADLARMLERQELARVAEEHAALEYERRILEREKTAGYGFTVARVRDLPGVRVNGRECVAVMLK